MIDELKLRQHITKALDGIQVTPAYFCHLVSSVIKELIANYELIDLKELQTTKQTDIKLGKEVKIQLLRYHQLGNEIYSHSHSNGDIPHNHHSSSYKSRIKKIDKINTEPIYNLPKDLRIPQL